MSRVQFVGTDGADAVLVAAGPPEDLQAAQTLLQKDVIIAPLAGDDFVARLRHLALVLEGSDPASLIEVNVDADETVVTVTLDALRELCANEGCTVRSMDDGVRVVSAVLDHVELRAYAEPHEDLSWAGGVIG